MATIRDYNVTVSNTTASIKVKNKTKTSYAALPTIAEIQSVTGEPVEVIDLSDCFRGCFSLTTAPAIPSGVTNMEYTFRNCSSLVTAPEIPSGATRLYYTFASCSSLVTAPEIPSSDTSLDYTFSGCSSLKEVTFLQTTPPRYNNTLSDCSKLETIYVPDSAVDAYKTATGWSQFASKIKPLSLKSQVNNILLKQQYIYVKIFKRFQYPCRIPSLFCIH